MYYDQNEAFLRAQLEDRLNTIFGALELPNGTLAREMVAAAIMIDWRHAKASATELKVLTDAQIVRAYAHATWLLFDRPTGGDITAPFGSVAIGERPGGLKVGQQRYVLDAGRGGLHEVEKVRRDAHGPNLALLRRLIERRTARPACRCLGVPSAVSLTDNQPRELLQFPPCAQMSGVALQRETYGSGADRFCAATPKQISALADAFVADMRRLWKDRKTVGNRVAEVRAKAEAAVRETYGDPSLTLRTIAIDMTTHRAGETPALYLEFGGLDESLRSGVILDFAPGRVEDWRPWVVHWQEERVQLLAEIAAAGADGRNDDMAAALAAAPGGAIAVLAPLAFRQEGCFAIETPLGRAHVTLYWREGVIRAEATVPGKIDLADEELCYTVGNLPEALVASLMGHRLDEVLDPPFASKSVVRQAIPLNVGGMRLTLEIGQSFVHLGSGRIW